MPPLRPTDVITAEASFSIIFVLFLSLLSLLFSLLDILLLHLARSGERVPVSAVYFVLR